MDLMVGLLDLPRRTPELGRIRLGEKGERGAPVKLKTFRLTSHSKAILDAAAAKYGGKVTRWDGAPDEGMWQLTTEASELNILLPGADRAITQSYELWAGGTCARRCDGTTVRTEKPDPEACICARLGQQGADKDCEIVTRFRVILPDLPGLGEWLLATSGYTAAITLPSTLELLAMMTPGAWIPAVLRAEQRSKKVRTPDGRVQTNRFVVPVLDLPGTTIGQLAAHAGLVDEPTMIEAPAPRTAREAVAARRAAIEATTSGGAPTTPESAPVSSTPAAAPAPAEAPPSAGAVPPEPLLAGELRERMRNALISVSDARRIAKAQFGRDDLDKMTDHERGALWLVLDKDARP